MIEYPLNGRTTPGYLVNPDNKDTHPAVVVIQEWRGLVPHIGDVAERFAASGYVALAPDLYFGEAAGELDEARKLAMALDRDGAAAEIVAAANYMTSLDSVAPKKVGVVGWCMGGVEHEVHIYRGAHHAFFNDTRPVYDPEAARDAWRRTLDWFQRYLAA